MEPGKTPSSLKATTSNCIWNVGLKQGGKILIISKGKRYKPSSKGIFMSLGFLIKISLRSKNKGVLCELWELFSSPFWIPIVEHCLWKSALCFKQTPSKWKCEHQIKVSLLIMVRKPRQWEAVSYISFGHHLNPADNGPLDCDMFMALCHLWIMYNMLCNFSREMTGYSCSGQNADSAGNKNNDKWIRVLANGSISLFCH